MCEQERLQAHRRTHKGASHPHRDGIRTQTCNQVSEGCSYQIGWIFGKFQTAFDPLPPLSFLENYVAIFLNSSPSWWEPETNLWPSEHDEDEVHVKQSYSTEFLAIKRFQKFTTCFAFVLFTYWRQLKDFLCTSQKTLPSLPINASYSQSPPDLNILRRDDHFGELHIRRLFPNFERFLKGFPGQNFVQISRQSLLKDIQGRSLTRPLLRQSCQMMAHNPRGKDC